MQKTLCGLTCIIFLSLLINSGSDGVFGDELAREDFDHYGPGSLTARDGGSGWDGPWLAASGSATVAPFDDTSSDVALSGDFASLGGNSRVARKLNVQAGGPLAAAGLVQDGLIGRDGGTLYVGFLQRITVLPTADAKNPAHLRFYSVEFNTSPADDTRVLEIGHDDRANPGSPEHYGVASVTNNNSPNHEPGQFQSLAPPDTEVNLIVVKFTFGPGGQDIVEVYRNPESTIDEGAAKVDAKLEGTFRFDRIALARFVGGTPVHQVGRSSALEPSSPTSCHRTPKRSKRPSWPNGRSDSKEHPKRYPQAVLPARKLLFVKRQMFQPTHVYTEVSDGPFLPGGGIFVLSPVRPDGQATMIFDAKGGICRDPEISFDGKRVLFSYRPQPGGLLPDPRDER